MHGELKQVADLALFARIVQTGGISRCAADLGMERTTISRRLASLEQTLGVKLLDRTPKHIAVTDAGQRCLEHCELLLESARNAQSLAIVGEVGARAAPIVVGAPPDILDRYLEPQLARFEAGHPDLRIERQPVTVWTADTLESVDLGIALAPVHVSGSWVNSVASIRQSVFASIDYESQHTPVQTPLDLEAHDCIVEENDRERHSWRFGQGDNVTTVTVNAKYVVAGLLDVREATLAGLGIARLPQYLCEPYLRAGRLIDLLPGTESRGRDIVVISPRQQKRKPGIAALRMYLGSALSA